MVGDIAEVDISAAIDVAFLHSPAESAHCLAICSAGRRHRQAIAAITSRKSRPMLLDMRYIYQPLARGDAAIFITLRCRLMPARERHAAAHFRWNIDDAMRGRSSSPRRAAARNRLFVSPGSSRPRFQLAPREPTMM